MAASHYNERPDIQKYNTPFDMVQQHNLLFLNLINIGFLLLNNIIFIFYSGGAWLKFQFT